MTRGKGKCVKATQKGIVSLKHYSKLHADEWIKLFLTRNLSAVCYHSVCYKAYTNERLLEQQKGK